MSTRRRLALASIALIGSVAATVAGASAAGFDVSSQLLAVFTSSETVPTTRCTLTASADTYVDQSASATTFGGDAQVSVRSEDAKNKRALVRFDLSACSIPQDAPVQSAALRLYAADPPAENRVQDIHRVTEAWDESSATWDAQPGRASTESDSAAVGTGGGVWVEWTVTGDVAAFVDGSAANEGWLVKDDSEGALLTGLQSDYPSREHSTTSEHPTLVVDYYP